MLIPQGSGMRKKGLLYLCSGCIAAFTCNVTHGAKICKVYSCNVGYYALEYSCPRCPSLVRADGSTQYGTTSAAGMSAITACYVPAGVKYKDATGQFEFTSNCNYSR